MSESKLLVLLREHTDKNNPLSQAELRSIPGANEIMGYKNTFTKRIVALADSLNTNLAGELLPETEWEIVFPGYKKIVEERQKGNNDISGIHIGKIYYNHRAAMIQLRKTEEKQGILYLYQETESAFSDKLTFIQDAIHRRKMLLCNMQIINEKGEYHFSKYTYLINPYKIVFFKSHYWLVCNRRYLYHYPVGNSLSDCNHISYKENLHDTLQSKHLFIYRIDKMENLRIPQDYRGQKARETFFPIGIEFDRIKTDMFYTHGATMQLAYSIYSFVINWDAMPDELRNDYSFIQDTFGNLWKFEAEKITIRTTPDLWNAWKAKYSSYLTDILEEFIPNKYENQMQEYWDWRLFS